MAGELAALFTDPVAMHEAAAALLIRLNGAARLDDDSFRPVRLTGRFDRTTAAGTDTRINITDTAQARDRIIVAQAGLAEGRVRALPVTALINGAPVPIEARGPRYLSRADDHPDVDELLTLMGDAEQLGWIELFKAFEIVKHAVCGGRKGIQTLSTRLGIPHAEITRFTGSANRPDVSGPGARHARVSGPPPTFAMTLPDARHFIRDLVRRWLDTLS